MGNGRWTPTKVLAAFAAFGVWSVAVAGARWMLRATDDLYRYEGGRGAASVAETRSPRIAECEAAWREWVLQRDGVALRDVTFRVVADEEFRARIGASWQADVRARVARASAVFEHEFRLRFVAASVGEWKSDDAAATIHELHASLARETAAEPADVVLAFTSQHAGARSADKDVYDRGVAYYYGRCCIVRAGLPSEKAAWPYEDETVLHEIGHTFGAWHSSDGRSVMRAVKRGRENSAFDACARTAILAARDLDFRRGTDCLDDRTVDSLHAVWAASHPADADFPPWQALCTEGWWARHGGDAALGVRRCDRALALDRRLGPFVRPPEFAGLVAWAEARRRR